MTEQLSDAVKVILREGAASCEKLAIVIHDIADCGFNDTNARQLDNSLAELGKMSTLFQGLAELGKAK